MFKEAAFFIASYFEQNIKFRQRFLNITAIALIFFSSLLCCNIAQGSIFCVPISVPMGSISFGNYYPLNLTANHITGSFYVNCGPNTSGSAASISWQANMVASGSTPGTSGNAGPMTSGSNTLTYFFYQNSNYTSGFEGGAEYISGSFTAAANGGFTNSAVVTFYPSIIAPQTTAVPGNYTYSADLYLTYTVNAGVAQTQATTIAVSATVPTACNVSTSALAFGNYNFTASTLATATISVTCTNTTTYTVGLNGGTGGTDTARYMANGANHLTYALYSNLARTINWGNSSGSWVSGTGTGSSQPLTVYGTVPSGQSTVPASGTAYSDIVTVTVSF